MIAIDENARRAITNARALLDAMLTGGWAELCVQGEEGDYFVARNPGTLNPLLAPAAATVAEVETACSADGPVKTISAPHVGTLGWLAPVGTVVAVGDVVAHLDVLDERIAVAATVDGQIMAHAAQPGDVAEFGTPLVTIA